MPSSHGRSIAPAVFVLALAVSAFVHADTTTPTAAQLLLQALRPPTPVIAYNNSTVASTSPTGAPQASAGIANPFLLVSLPSLLSPNASPVPQNAIVPGATMATTPATATASSTNSLIASLYAEVKVLEAELAALETAASTPASCTPLTLTRSLTLGSKGSDVSALQRFLEGQSYYTYPSITGYFGSVSEKAVAAFQIANGISPMGSVGPLTRAKIAALSASCASSVGSASPASLPAPTSASSTATTTTPGLIAPIIGGYGGGGGGGSSGGGGGGSSDTTPPSVSLTAPSSGATVSGSSVTLTATASDNVAVANVQFKVDGSNIGSAITSSLYTTTWNSTGVSDGSHTLYAVAEDTSGNYATSSISVTVSNPPVISSISSNSSTTTSAIITWTTNENATSKVAYGTTTSYGSASTSASLVTSHSITLVGLTASSTYHYAIVSTDSLGNSATSSNETFTTTTQLPPGVTLQQIDGGPTYYASNGFTYAANAGWDNASFFPIGPWLAFPPITQSDANRWIDLGWNTAFCRPETVWNQLQ